MSGLLKNSWKLATPLRSPLISPLLFSIDGSLSPFVQQHLLSYWTLNSSLQDSYGSNPLSIWTDSTPGGTPIFSSGLNNHLGNALSLGVHNFVGLSPNPFRLPPTTSTAYSYTSWFYQVSPPGKHYFGSWAVASASGWVVWPNNQPNVVYLAAANGTINDYFSMQTTVSGWFFLGIITAGNYISMTVNGNPLQTDSLTFTSGQDTNYWGYNPSVPVSGYQNGNNFLTQHLTAWNCPLSQNQFNWLYNNGNGRNESEVIANMPMV